MIKQISRMMALVAFAGFVVGATGCKSVCLANKKAGLATIVCQPMDVEVTNKDQRIEFKVQAIGRDLTYQWYFNSTALQDSGKEGRGYSGVNEPKLVVSHFTADKIGFYHCEIDSKDCLSLPLRTATRSATLGTAFMLKDAAPPTQPLPPPGAPTTNLCGGKYCASVCFRNGTTGYIPPATLPSGVAPIKCLLTVSANGVVQSTSVYDVQVNDGRNKPYCAGNESDGQTKSFAVTAGTHAYRFTVYFKCPSPKGSPLISLVVDWQ
jgi:hypothetical protein